MPGIIDYGAYLPYHRLDRATIGEALGVRPTKGTRTVASYDEDATTMAVAAAQRVDVPKNLTTVYLASTSPPYTDKTNATAVHAALGLDPAIAAFDAMGSVRSSIGALRAGLDSPEPALVLLSDTRTGLPGSDDERDGGDGAAALVLGPASDGAPLIAEYLGGASATGEFLDRWRTPGAPSSEVWEERFGVHAFLPLAGSAISSALTSTGIDADAIDHVIITGTHSRAARTLVRAGGLDASKIVDDLSRSVGNTGAAHPALLLASALDEADAGQVIALIVLADGADVLLFRTTAELHQRRKGPSVAAQIAAGGAELPYAQYATWRGFLDRQPPRRPDPQRPAAPPSFRSEPWKYAFSAGTCTKCDTRHLPPQRVCINCGAIDQMKMERLAETPGTIATFTVDHLAHSPSPPVVAAVIDFDGGGRFRLELTDVDPTAIAIGDRVAMTFRRLNTARGIHNYFWKARPAETQEAAAAPAAGEQGA